MVRDRRSAGCDVHIALHQLMRGDIHIHIEQVRVAVQMVKILEERKIHALLHIFVRLVLRQPRREVHGKVFVTDGSLELRFVAGRKPVNGFLLHLLLAAAGRDLAAQFVVRTVPVELLAEHNRLGFNPVHQDYAAFRVGVRIIFGIWFLVKLFPAKEAFVHCHWFFFKRVHHFLCSSCKLWSFLFNHSVLRETQRKEF